MLNIHELNGIHPAVLHQMAYKILTFIQNIAVGVENTLSINKYSQSNANCFFFFLTVRLRIILVSDQLDAQFLL